MSSRARPSGRFAEAAHPHLQKNERAGEDHAEIAGYVIEDFKKFGELRYHAGRFWQWKGACWEESTEVVFPEAHR